MRKAGTKKLWITSWEARTSRTALPRGTCSSLISRLPLGCWIFHIHCLPITWIWKIQQPSGKREINELHVPLGRAVRLVLASQDVIHSFFVPAFRIKQDAVPGRYTSIWFQPTRLGEYHLFCAEYCGTNHSAMIGRVVVMEPERYQTWLTGSPVEETPAQA